MYSQTDANKIHTRPTIERAPSTAPSLDTQRAFPVYHRKFGNPAPLGLFALAGCSLVVSLSEIGARNVVMPNMAVGLCLYLGGAGMYIAGLWEFVAGNTFGATAFTLYSGYWISYALIFLPSTGIQAAYSGANEHQFHDAMGIYWTAWVVTGLTIFLSTWRSSIALASVFFFLFIKDMLLACGSYTQNDDLTKAAGVIGCITAILGFYTACAELYSPDASYFALPVGDLPKRMRE